MGFISEHEIKNSVAAGGLVVDGWFIVRQCVGDESSKADRLIIVSHSQPRRAKKVLLKHPNNTFANLMDNSVVLDQTQSQLPDSPLYKHIVQQALKLNIVKIYMM